ncbi:MAG: metallophosphoesterase [Alphaproteobacteria bacterium]
MAAFLRNLFRRNGAARGNPTRRARPPAGTRVYAVGDIHGRADLLDELHRMIAEDAAGVAAARRVVVYLGDYIDRGFESRRVLDILIDAPLDGFEAVHLLGNHEQALLDFLADVGTGPAWMSFGGDATLVSYAVGLPAKLDRRSRLEVARADLKRRLPDAHLDFLRNLALYHVEGDYLFVHAGIRPGVALEKQSREDMIWIRDAFLNSSVDHGRIVVHGHTIHPDLGAPDMQTNRIGIDTGAYASGRLTCLVLDGAQRRFLQT